MLDAKKLLDAFVGAGQQMAPSSGESGGQGGGGAPDLAQLTGILRQVLGQATSGVKEVAGKADQATGASAKLDELLKGATGGQGSEELIAKAKQMMRDNQMATGAVLGGLAAILIGTRAGRGMLGTGAKLGGLAMIGGLAYKAWQNHQAGKPLISGADPVAQPAPSGSGFEPAAASNEIALVYLRAMIAAASADGAIDADERGRIAGAFREAGLNATEAKELEAELSRPASIDELAAAASRPETAIQLYAAARLAVDPKAPGNRAFLDKLAARLKLDPALTQHIDAQSM